VLKPTLTTQALIIGTGIAGLFTALKLADEGVAVCLVTKTSLAESNSRYAQGGIAAVLPHNLNDSIDLHVEDTLKAGANLCNPTVVRSILAEGYAAITDLLTYGVSFDQDAKTQTLALTQEAAHSVRRILHAGGDATGQSVELALIHRLQQHPQVHVLEHCTIHHLWTHNHQCHGAIGWHQGQTVWIQAPAVVLATGGAGQLYPYTTNPPIATGDGLYLAKHAGAALQDLEFVQFHPTAFYATAAKQVRFLVSEALRGEGAVLLNHANQRFAFDYHTDGELAPRDVVTRALFAEQLTTQKPHMWLRIAEQPRTLVESRFPTILRLCQAEGVDIRTESIPVSPAAHYMMGGVAVNLHAQTTLAGLYAVGEVACSGLHGANRLASNSLLECVVLARRAAHHIAQHNAKAAPNVNVLTPPATHLLQIPAPLPMAATTLELMANVRQLMWTQVGIVRTTHGLQQAVAQLTQWCQQFEGKSHTAHWQAMQLAHVALWVAQAALNRPHSVGAHFLAQPPYSNELSPPASAASCHSG
jgi:L-aspartate oxidase